MGVLKDNLKSFFSEQINNFQIYYIIREYSELDKGYKYDSFYCNMSNDFALDLSNGYKEKLKICENQLVVPYNIICKEDESIEQIEAKNVNNLSDIKKLLNNNISKLAADINVDISEVWGYAIVFKNEKNEKLTLFRKYSLPKYFNENKNFNFINGTIKEIKNDIFSLDMKFDSILYNDNIYIINKYYFELFFSFKEQYVKFVNDSLESLRKEDILENFDDFVQRCLESGNLLKKLVYIVKNHRLSWLKKNMKSANETIKDYGLKVELDEKNNKIVYSKKSCNISDVMTLICGSCVKDAIDQHKYFASSVREVK